MAECEAVVAECEACQLWELWEWAVLAIEVASSRELWEEVDEACAEFASWRASDDTLMAVSPAMDALVLASRAMVDSCEAVVAECEALCELLQEFEYE